MRKLREALKMLLPAVGIAAAVYFAASVLFARTMPDTTAGQETAARTEASEHTQQEDQTKEEDRTKEETGGGAPAEEAQADGNVSDAVPDDGYARSRLGAEDAALYQELYEAVTGFSENTPLSVWDAERIERVFACMLADHPEIFYVNGYTLTTRTLGETVQEVSFQAVYTFTQAEARERAARVGEAADAVLSSLTPDMDDYEKLKLLYEAVVLGTEYDLNAPENQTLCSVFLYGRSVCQGYAKAFQYLCQRAGIPAVLVTGTVNAGEPHAWTAVRCNGAWYYADPAWGDVSYQTKDGGEQDPEGSLSAGQKEQVDYGYFLVTARQLFLTHTPDETFLLPECTSMTDNYYVREGLYFSQADMEQAVRAFERALQEGASTVTFQCADRAVYEELYDRLLSGQEIFQYLDRASVSYAVSEERLALTFFW